MHAPELIREDADLRLERLVVPPLENNVWIVTTPHGGFIVDAPSRGELLVELARARGITAVLITHGHPDHIGAAASLHDAGMAIWMGAADAPGHPWVDHPLERETILAIGGLTVRARPTPGHTIGSVCYDIRGELCFTGDTLFPGGPGKTVGADAFTAVIASVRDVLFATLDDACLVLPGHGPTTTIGTERPHLDEWIERGW